MRSRNFWICVDEKNCIAKYSNYQMSQRISNTFSGWQLSDGGIDSLSIVGCQPHLVCDCGVVFIFRLCLLDIVTKTLLIFRFLICLSSQSHGEKLQGRSGQRNRGARINLLWWYRRYVQSVHNPQSIIGIDLTSTVTICSYVFQYWAQIRINSKSKYAPKNTIERMRTMGWHANWFSHTPKNIQTAHRWWRSTIKLHSKTITKSICWITSSKR